MDVERLLEESVVKLTEDYTLKEMEASKILEDFIDERR